MNESGINYTCIGLFFMLLGIFLIIFSFLKFSIRPGVHEEVSGYILFGPVPLKIGKNGIQIDGRIICYTTLLFILFCVLYVLYIALLLFYK